MIGKPVTLLFASLVSAVVCAETLKFDNRFIQEKGERSVRGWTFNAVKSYMPFGDVECVMKDGEAGVRLASKGKNTTIYLKDGIPVKAGDVLVVSAKVAGKGRGNIGVFRYGDRWKWMGTDSVSFRASGPDLTAVSGRLVIPEGVRSVRPSMTSISGDVSVYGYNIGIERNAVK